jgi:hypothetical protein
MRKNDAAEAWASLLTGKNGEPVDMFSQANVPGWWIGSGPGDAERVLKTFHPHYMINNWYG